MRHAQYQAGTKAAIDRDDETGEGAENDARELWICMDEEDLDDVLPSFLTPARHLALMRNLRAAARIVAPLLGLYKAVLEKTCTRRAVRATRAPTTTSRHTARRKKRPRVCERGTLDQARSEDEAG